MSEPASEPRASSQDETTPPKPSRIKQLWDGIGLDAMTMITMFKGSLPPIIAIAAYQSKAFAARFSTLGYLVAIASILGFCIMPRGKFISNMALEVIAICLGAAVNLLALFCAVQARAHTTPQGQPLAGYNSSASAVLAIWLIVQVYAVNALRAAKPQYQFPAILYSIFVSVSASYGTQFPDMASCISFMVRLLEAFLAGFAICTGVHVCVFPVSSRTVVFKEMTGYMASLTGLLKAQGSFMASLEDLDPVAARKQLEQDENNKKHNRKTKGSLPSPLTTPAAVNLRNAINKTLELHAKLQGDIVPAKREFAYGKLESHDLSSLARHLRKLLTPIIGLSATLELLQRRAVEANWGYEAVTASERETRQRQIDSLHFLMLEMRAPFAKMSSEIEKGIQHILLTMELVKPPKQKAQDVEEKGDDLIPGSPTFMENYKNAVGRFHESKETTLRDWCREHNIDIPPGFFDENFVGKVPSHDGDKLHSQRQLFFALYLEYLLYRASETVLDCIVFCERRKSEGALKRSKLIFPGSKTLYKWLKATFEDEEDLSQDGHFMAEMDTGGSHSVSLGAAFGARKDPEHLPPSNTLEMIGDRIRSIPRFLRSDASAFGIRVVLATMSIAIIAFLEATQTFFLQQRLLWAMIMVSISMTRTAGQSLFNFVLRVLGTAIAMLGSFVVWYIVDSHAPGVIVFLWLWIMGSFYFVAKTPKFIVVAILSMVTAVLIIGYELQVGVIGKTASEASGQPAYPTYLLAPYRLATVAGGILVAFFWTIFPFPISENSEIRKDLGATLYLLSNFYSIVHETTKSRVDGTDGDVNVKGTHAYNLEKARNAVLGKLMLLLSTLKTNTAFAKFQLHIGGKFPRDEYEDLIDCCSRLVQYTSLVGYASATFSLYERHGTSSSTSRWSSDFRQLVASIAPTSHEITSLLALLSSAITNGQPLPPYLAMPQPLKLIREINTIDPDMLSVRHIAEREFSSFAVLQIAQTAISDDIEKLARHVKNLVGEVDFTFHAVSSSQESTVSSSSEDDKEK